MRIPRISATIDRRLLINYRVDPAVAQTLLPAGLRPQLVDESAVAGVCLLRLKAFRPTWVRPEIGWGAENAAHRIAVEWDTPDGVRSGVYVPIRHSASWVPVLAGGRVFPGVHRHAAFDVTETDDRIQVALTAPDVSVQADVAVSFTFSSSLFSSLAAASDFFAAGSVRLSPSRSGSLEALQLGTDSWSVSAGEATSVSSSFFDGLAAGSAVLDLVLVMRKVPITWSVPAFTPVELVETR